jgi:hypothetical protein
MLRIDGRKNDLYVGGKTSMSMQEKVRAVW